MPHGRPEELFAGCLGIAAAVLVVGGWILVRLLRDRQQFRLMQLALERGITAMPGMTPGWVMSLRQGIMALALGLGLLLAGRAMYRLADHIEAAPADLAATGDAGAMTQPNESARMQGRRPPPPPPERGGPPDGWDRLPGQGGGPGPGGREMPPPEPPRLSPAMERWHRVESQKTLGQICGFVGGILVLLGLVRTVFAFVEKKYATDLAPPGNASAGSGPGSGPGSVNV